MKKLVSTFMILFSVISVVKAENNIQLSIAGNYMFEVDNLYFAEIDRYYYVGDAFIFKAEADYYLEGFNNKFGVGIYASIGAPWYDGFEETSMTEFGPTLKWKFDINEFKIIPSLYIGYRSYEGEAGDGLGLNLSLKAQYPQEGFIPFVDFGFLSQPAGGNDATDITFAPVFIIGGGISIEL